jgi:hypothetical protein
MGSMSEFYAFQRFVLDDGVAKNVPMEESAYVLAEIWTSGMVRQT